MIDFKKEAAAVREDLTKDLAALVQIPSVYDADTVAEHAPYGKYSRQALDFMLDLGRRDGYEVVDVDGHGGHIVIGDGEETLGILCHIDVVPVTEKDWSYPPFGAEIHGGKMYGRGVSDDKGPTLASYYAAKIAHKAGLLKSRKVHLFFGCNEEKGCPDIQYYFTKVPYPDIAFAPDSMFPLLYGEKELTVFYISGETESKGLRKFIGGKIYNAVPEKAEAWLEGTLGDYEVAYNEYLAKIGLPGEIRQDGDTVQFTLYGVSAHALQPEMGRNAATYLACFLAKYSDNRFLKFIKQYFEDDYNGVKPGVAYDGEMGNTSSNLGIANYEDGKVYMAVNIRYSYEMNLDQVKSKMESAVRSYDFSISDLTFMKAIYMDPQCDYAKTLVGAYQEISGDYESKPFATGSQTYCRFCPNSVAFGMEQPGVSNNPHGNDECLDLDWMETSVAVYAKAIADLCK